MHTFPTKAKPSQHHTKALVTLLASISIPPHPTTPWRNRQRFPSCGKRHSRHWCSHKDCPFLILAPVSNVPALPH